MSPTFRYVSMKSGTSLKLPRDASPTCLFGEVSGKSRTSREVRVIEFGHNQTSTESKLDDWYIGQLQDVSANPEQNIGWAEHIACTPNVTVGRATAHPSHPVPTPLIFMINLTTLLHNNQKSFL